MKVLLLGVGMQGKAADLLGVDVSELRKRGVLSPVNDVPFGPFVQDLGRRDIQITSERSTRA